MTVTALRDAILSLPPDDRAHLLDALWASLTVPATTSLDAAWAAESERRIDAYDRGTLAARDADDVFRDLEKPLRRP